MPLQPTATISRRSQRRAPESSLRVGGPGVSLNQRRGLRTATRHVADPSTNSVATMRTTGAAPAVQATKTTFTPPPTATEAPQSAPVVPSATLQPGEFDVAVPANFKPSLRTGSRVNRPALAAATNALEKTVVNGKTLAQERVEPVLNAEQAAAAKQRAVAGGERLRRGFRSPRERAEDRRQETLGLRRRRLGVDEAAVQAGVDVAREQAGAARDVAAEQGAVARDVAGIRGQADVDVAKAGGLRTRRRVVQQPIYNAEGKRVGTENVIVDPETGTQQFPDDIDAQGNPLQPAPINPDSYQTLFDSLDDAKVAGFQAGNYKGSDTEAIKKLDEAWIAIGGTNATAPHRTGKSIEEAVADLEGGQQAAPAIQPRRTAGNPQPFASIEEAEAASLPVGTVVTVNGKQYRME